MKMFRTYIVDRFEDGGIFVHSMDYTFAESSEKALLSLRAILDANEWEAVPPDVVARIPAVEEVNLLLEKNTTFSDGD